MRNSWNAQISIINEFPWYPSLVTLKFDESGVEKFRNRVTTPSLLLRSVNRSSFGVHRRKEPVYIPPPLAIVNVPGAAVYMPVARVQYRHPPRGKINSQPQQLRLQRRCGTNFITRHRSLCSLENRSGSRTALWLTFRDTPNLDDDDEEEEEASFVVRGGGGISRDLSHTFL